MSVIENKLVPVDYDGNGTADLGFFRPIAPGADQTIRGQLAVWLLGSPAGLPTAKAEVGGQFPYANGNSAELGDGYIPGFSGPVDFFFSGPAPLFPDFNGDGKTDQVFGSLVYSNPLDANTFQGYELATWFMDGTGLVGQQSIFNSAGNVAIVREEWADPFLYNIGGQGPLGDFNGDNTTDILFLRENENGTTSIALWLMENGTAVTQPIIGDAGVGWDLVNTNDFNGNGTTDLLFTQTTEEGPTNLGIWLQEGATSTARTVIGAAGTGWSVVDTNDFNGDGNADILFSQDIGGGANVFGVWTLNGTQVTGKSQVGGSSSAGWSLLDHNDFNGDGKADLLFENSGTRELAVWLLDGTSAPIAQQVVGTLAAGWTFSGSGDANGDGIADLAFYNDTTKQVGGWLFGSDGLSPLSSRGVIGSYANPDGWEEPFTQPDFDIPPFSQAA